MDCITIANNQAARFIESGLYEEAIKLLKASLKRGRELASRQEENSSSQTGEDHEASSDLREVIADATLLQAQASQLQGIRLCDEDSPFLYRSPIFLSTNWKKPSDNQTFSIMVFNLGLAHHLEAIASKGSRQYQKNDALHPMGKKKFELALKFYEMASTLVKLDCQESNQGSSLSIALACINNSALIFRELKQERRADQLLIHMSATLMMMIESGQAKNVDELDGFLSSVSTVILAKSAAAAA